MSINIAIFRFYEELNDFLPTKKKNKEFLYQFNGNPSIKEAIETLGVPHPEIDLILVNGISVGFDYHLQHEDRIFVYPVFESLDISAVTLLKKKPLRLIAFILDVHLGTLAKLLRMLGFDTLYKNNFKDIEIINMSLRENRIILTRDRGILKNKTVTYGYWLRSVKPIEQSREIINRFDLVPQIKPFQRCISCNGMIRRIEKKSVMPQLSIKTACDYNEFYKCMNCSKIYWKGSHYNRMKAQIDLILH